MYSSLGLLNEFVFLYLGDEVEEKLKKNKYLIKFFGYFRLVFSFIK